MGLHSNTFTREQKLELQKIANSNIVVADALQQYKRLKNQKHLNTSEKSLKLKAKSVLQEALNNMSKTAA